MEFDGTRLAPAGWVAVGVGSVGLVLLAVSADPGPARSLPPQWHWVLLALAVPVAVLGFAVQRRAALLLAFGAGLGFCFVGVSARTLEPPASAWQLVLEPSVWAIPVNGSIHTGQLRRGRLTDRRRTMGLSRREKESSPRSRMSSPRSKQARRLR